MYKKRDARQGSCFAHSMELKKIAFLTFSLPSPSSLRSLHSNYEHNFCLFSTGSIIYTFNKFCSTELSFKDHALGGTFYNGLYGEAPPERGTFFRFQVYERVGISLVEVYKRVGKSFIWVRERPKRANR